MKHNVVDQLYFNKMKTEEGKAREPGHATTGVVQSGGNNGNMRSLQEN